MGFPARHSRLVPGWFGLGSGHAVGSTLTRPAIKYLENRGMSCRASTPFASAPGLGDATGDSMSGARRGARAR